MEFLAFRIDDIVSLPLMEDTNVTNYMYLEKFKNYEQHHHFRDVVDNNGIPEKIIFKTYLTDISVLDVPANDVFWPVFSNRMIDALLTLSKFDHVRIPVEIIQKNGDVTYNYSILHLTSHCDYFDFEKSNYEEDTPGSYIIYNAVLKIPEGETLPPYFRLKLGSNYNQFVSAEAKELLDSMGVIGINYYPLDEFFPA